MIESKVQDHPVDKSVIANAMNYNRMHGTFYEAVNALIQYKLVVTVGDQLKVSAEALKILQSSEENPEEYINAIKRAAFAPPLFKELYNLYGNTLPDNQKLKEFFTRKGLSQNKIDFAVRSYRDTIRFVNEKTIRSDETSNSGVSKQPQTFKHASISDSGRSGLSPSSLLDEKKGIETELKFRDSGGYEVQIKFNGPVTSERLQDLIEFAQFQKKVYLKREGAEFGSVQQESESRTV